MKNYDYREAVKEDVRHYVKYEINLDDWKGNREELEEKLNEDLWINDSVTGNASGSYTFSTWKAEENLAHNWDLMKECADMTGDIVEVSDDWYHGAEWWDVSIRCYLLSESISEVLDEFEEELKGE